MRGGLQSFVAEFPAKKWYVQGDYGMEEHVGFIKNRNSNVNHQELWCTENFWISKTDRIRWYLLVATFGQRSWTILYNLRAVLRRPIADSNCYLKSFWYFIKITQWTWTWCGHSAQCRSGLSPGCTALPDWETGHRDDRSPTVSQLPTATF